MVREFDTGANRNSDEDKLDYEGFSSPIVEWAFAQYMHKNRLLEDGTMRDSDNWQKGIPKKELLKSAHRHWQDVRLIHRGFKVIEKNYEKHEIHQVTELEALLGLKFNIDAMIHSILKDVTAVSRNYE